MLILNRKKGESIIIDSNIKVTIMSTFRGSTQVGIEAPDHISIYREEIQKKIDEEVDTGKILK